MNKQRKHYRYILFCYRKNKNAVQAQKKLCGIYGEDCHKFTLKNIKTTQISKNPIDLFYATSYRLHFNKYINIASKV